MIATDASFTGINQVTVCCGQYKLLNLRVIKEVWESSRIKFKQALKLA